tara:strand:+ start:1315 stop:2142 length:828 start_codon:yes stop_codon:yes gene_type:complete
MSNIYKLGHVDLHYNDDDHSYYVDEKRVPGVTTITHLCDKPQLAYWLKTTPLKALHDKVEQCLATSDPIDGLKLKNMYDDSLKACDYVRDQAGDIGTIVHDLFEKIVQNKPYIPPTDEKVLSSLNHLMLWYKSQKVVVEVQEKKLYSKKYGYAGTLDLICTMNGKKTKYLLDLKTSNYITEDMMYQLHAYRQAYLEETGEKINKLGIIKAPKTSDKSMEIMIVNYSPQYLKGFLGLLEQHRCKSIFKLDNKNVEKEGRRLIVNKTIQDKWNKKIK